MKHDKGETITLSEIKIPMGIFTLAKSEKGLLFLAFPGEKRRMKEWLEKNIPSAVVKKSRSASGPAEKQLKEYFQGKCRKFDLPLDLRGTAFQKKVWAALRRIPFGRTASYGEIAARIGKPRASRAVGGANHANPVPVVVPCHRVIGHDGSLVGFGGGLGLKKKLLKLEE